MQTVRQFGIALACTDTSLRYVVFDCAVCCEQGGMFSGHTESGGEHIRIGDKEFVEFYGSLNTTTGPHCTCRLAAVLFVAREPS